MSDTKICSKCGLEKPLSDFSKNKLGRDGLHSQCKDCKNNYGKEYRLENKEEIDQYFISYRQNNKQIISDRNKIYYLDNKEEINSHNQQYYLDNKEQISQIHHIYYENNKEKLFSKRNVRTKIRRKEDISFRLRINASTAIGSILKINGGSKNGFSIMKYLSYSIQELKEHLEAQFEPWMNWDNHGKYHSKTWDDNNTSTWTWQIDHIIPQAILPYTSMEDENFQKCWSLSNLRPYSAKLNFLDGAKRTRHIK